MAFSGLGRSLASSPARRAAVLLPLVIIVDVVVVSALGLLPLNSVAGLRCDPVLRGGEPQPNRFLSPLVAASRDKLCSDASHGRAVVMVFVGLLVLVFGLGAIFAPADRLERFLAHDDDEDDAGWEYVAQDAEDRDARIREERALADARRAAHTPQEDRRQAASEDREARVARARAARLEARSRPAGAPTKKAAAKKVSKATKAIKSSKASKVTKVTKASKVTKVSTAATVGAVGAVAGAVVTTKALSRKKAAAPAKKVVRSTRSASAEKAARTRKAATASEAVTTEAATANEAATGEAAITRRTVTTRKAVTTTEAAPPTKAVLTKAPRATGTRVGTRAGTATRVVRSRRLVTADDSQTGPDTTGEQLAAPTAEMPVVPMPVESDGTSEPDGPGGAGLGGPDGLDDAVGSGMVAGSSASDDPAVPVGSLVSSGQDSPGGLGPQDEPAAGGEDTDRAATAPRSGRASVVRVRRSGSARRSAPPSEDAPAP